MFASIKLFIKDLIKFLVTLPFAWLSFRKTSKQVRSARLYISKKGKVDYFLTQFETIAEDTPKWAKKGILDEFIIHADDEMKEHEDWISVITYRSQLEKD